MSQSRKQYVVCIKNRGYEVSLEPRKIYEVLPDEDAAAHSLVRVIDESGEDYLYDRDLFVQITVPQEALSVFSGPTKRKRAAAASATVTS